MHRREDAHRLLVAVLARDALIHVKEVAVAFLDLVRAEPLDGIREIEIDTEPTRANAPAFVAHFLRGAARNIARREIAEARVFAFEDVIAIRLGDLCG